MRTEDLRLLADVARLALEDSDLNPMLQRIADRLREHFDCALVALIRVDRENDRFVCEEVSSVIATEVQPGYSRPLGSGVVGIVALTGAPVVISDASRSELDFVQTAESVAAEICVPVYHRAELISVLNLESQEAGAFDQALDLVQQIAAQIAGAIASARMVEELEHRARLLQHLNTVSKIAASAENLESMVAKVTGHIVAEFAVDAASILVLDDDGEHFEWEGTAGSLVLEPPTEGAWPITVGVCGRCIRTGELQLITDPGSDQDYVPGNPDVLEELVIPIRHGDLELGVLNLESTRHGAFDAVLQLAFRNIADQIAGSMHMFSVLENLEDANHRLEDLSNTDGLTGIPNRRRFDQAFEDEWNRARRHGQPLALLMIDVDRFKDYNDAHGHLAGDECLRQIAGDLRRGIGRAGELVARYGGEEFAVLIPNAGRVEAERSAEHLRRLIEGSAIPRTDGPPEIVTVSIGLGAVLPEDDDRDGFVGRVDKALYKAKAAGRNRTAGI